MAVMRTNILRSLLTAVAVVALVNAVTLILSPYESPRFLPVIVTALLAEVFMIGGALAFVDRMTERKAPEPDADEDTGSPYRSQVQSGSGNVQAGGDIYNADADGDVAIKLDDFLVVTESLRGVGLRTDRQTLTLTHRGQTFMIRYEPRS